MLKNTTPALRLIDVRVDITSQQNERTDELSAMKRPSTEDKERISEFQGIIQTREKQIAVQRERIERLLIDVDGMTTVYHQSQLSLHDIDTYRNQLDEAQKEARSREEHIRDLRADLKKEKESTAREVGRRVEAKYEAEDWKADARAWEARAKEFGEKSEKSKAKIAKLETDVDKWMTKARNWEAAFESLAERVGSLKAGERLASLYRDSPQPELEAIVDKLARSTTPTSGQGPLNRRV